MKLSEYCDKKEKIWYEIEESYVQKFIDYLSKNIEEDLFRIANTNDSMEVFDRLKLWIFNFYNKEFLDGLKFIDTNYNDIKKRFIYSFILTFTRNNRNAELMYDVLKSFGIIENLLVYDDYYELITNDFGNIKFMKAEDSFADDMDTIEYIHKMGDKIKDGCHDVSFYLIKKYDIFRAITAICTKGLNEKYYHSFVIDDEDYVIDFTGNLIMPKEQYYLLQDVKELNSVNYKEYLDEKDDIEKFDESGTLYELLRDGLYRQYLNEND